MPVLSGQLVRLEPLTIEHAPGYLAAAGSATQSAEIFRWRSVPIGHTWLGQRWWGTGVNAEAKLLLMGFAFETLGAVRVAWVTDIRNTRSQAAIGRLGAAREGVLALLDDEWPTAELALTARLDRRS
ncbi:hypothetical protein DMB66_27760 [Actinoplanes sp. ATCC 53533]|uniref:GNAT family N-acetyltransferase n=1 Tax=Actinoplanes sp. ATCC 53533 TaxID=1288362 RepID=UPI000F7A8A7B|nr:GNAT family protein [Actinoplanes sp. ATCC 53533]RSM59484.1 hypothetical protein DMB66_27760 [Actinoplanes sp. ATCC 53533]